MAFGSDGRESRLRATIGGDAFPVRAERSGDTLRVSFRLPPGTDARGSRFAARLKGGASLSFSDGEEIAATLTGVPPDATFRIEIDNVVASKNGPAAIHLFRKGEPPTFPGGARVAIPWALAAGFLPLLYGLLLGICERRLGKAPLYPAWLAVPAGLQGAASLLAAFFLPFGIAATSLSWGLIAVWPTAILAAFDLARRRAAFVQACGDSTLRERFRDRRAALALFAASFALYNVNFTSQDAVDSIPCPYAALSLAREGDFDLEEFPALAPFTNEIEFVDSAVIDTKEHWVSKYPPGGALLSAPILGLADLVGLLDPEEKRNMLFYGKVAASFYTALSVAGVYAALLVLSRRAPALFAPGRRAATGIALVYAFGSSTWSTSSQSAWQHGFVECFVAWSLWRSAAGIETLRAQAALGAFLSLAVLSRPTNLLLVIFSFLPWIVERRWRALPGVAAGALPGALLFTGYGAYYFGTPFSTGYGPELVRFQKMLWEGVPGLLVSPNRGLFVFSPVLLFAIPGLVRLWRAERDVDAVRLLRLLSLGSLAVLLLFAQWNAWDGGWCYGCRMLTDILPVLFIFTAVGWQAARAAAAGRAAFFMAAALSIGIHALGVVFHNNDWNADPASRPWRTDRTQIGSHLERARLKLFGS